MNWKFFRVKKNILRVIKYGIIWCLSTKVVGNLNIHEHRLLRAIEDDETENAAQISESLLELPLDNLIYNDDEITLEDDDDDESDNGDIDEREYVNVCLRADQIGDLNDL